MLAAIALMLISLPQQGQPLPLNDGGFCVGLGWMTPSDREHLTVDIGPDFRVFRYNGPKGVYWGAYSGFASQVSNSTGAALLVRDGVTIRAAIVDGQFRGYLATRGGAQNHFFGSVFHNDASDRAFFDRIDFGPVGQSKCKKQSQ